MLKAILVGLASLAIALSIFVAVRFYYNQDESVKAGKIFMEAADRGVPSLSDLGIFQDADLTCVLHPYAVRAGHSQSASLGNIFGSLDYQPWREGILKRHVDGYFWTIYSAVDGKINKSFPLNSTRSFGYKMGAKFHAGCFPPNSICIERRDDDPDKKQVILFSFCKQENQK